jgi:hypothetical protein
MPGLVPGIHVFLVGGEGKTWMAGTSPAMTCIYFCDVFSRSVDLGSCP